MRSQPSTTAKASSVLPPGDPGAAPVGRAEGRRPPQGAQPSPPRAATAEWPPEPDLEEAAAFVRPVAAGRKPKGKSMKRNSSTRIKATATLTLACATALVFAVTTVQARPTSSAGSQEATAAAVSSCKIVITGAPWHVHGPDRSGDKYTLAAEGMSCASARARVVALTHQPLVQLAAFKGPSGFTCRSFSTTASGDKLLYAGVCMRGPPTSQSSSGHRKRRDTEPTLAPREPCRKLAEVANSDRSSTPASLKPQKPTETNLTTHHTQTNTRTPHDARAAVRQ